MRSLLGRAWRILLTVTVLCLVGCGKSPSPTGPSSTDSPVNFTTSRVSLFADDFRLEIDGVVYRGNTLISRLTSDSGNPTYCTLEVYWIEHDVQMRLFIYFNADQGSWWSNEIRTYNGKKSGDWVYYRGEFFKTPLGGTFTADALALRTTGATSEKGLLTFKNLRLQAFK